MSWYRQRSTETQTIVSGPLIGPASYPDALADANRRVADKRQLAGMFPGDWVRGEALANAYADRFRLTGDYADLAQATATIAAARQRVQAPAGPLLAEAEIAMIGHRLDAAQAALDGLGAAVAPDPSEQAESEALRGDIAFYRGDMAGASAHYEKPREGLGAGSASRVAIMARARGDYADAISALTRTAKGARRSTHFGKAMTLLQAGGIELARGDSAKARTFFEAADRAFPGYWLTQAHLAQADALDGKVDVGIARMRVLARATGNAEVMDALAMLLRTYGQASESREWAQKAAVAWGTRLAQVPEAAIGHAVEHELVFGSPARALDLARQAVAHRPFGESRLLLASAFLQTGAVADALREIATAERTGWRSAPLFALKAEALSLAGRGHEADEARRAAIALNPQIFERVTALVWFSHG